MENENKIIQIKESDLAKMTKEEISTLKLEIEESGSELEVIYDLTEDMDNMDINNQELTYFQEPIILTEDEILENENFKKGLEHGYRLGGVFTAMVNSGLSRELAENYAVENALFETKLEIAKMEQDSKSLESEYNSI